MAKKGTLQVTTAASYDHSIYLRHFGADDRSFLAHILDAAR